MKKIIATGVSAVISLGMLAPILAGAATMPVTHAGATSSKSMIDKPGKNDIPDVTRHTARTSKAVIDKPEKGDTPDTGKSAVHASGVRRVTQGTVKSVSTGSLVLNSGSIEYSISTQSAKIIDKIWTAMPFASIKVGDIVRVTGVVTGNSIAAKTVRDISVSAPTKVSKKHSTATTTKSR